MAIAAPDTIIHEIENAVRRLNKIFKDYEEVGEGLETQIHLRLSHHESRVYYSLNDEWSASIKQAVQKAIGEAASKYPQITVTLKLKD